MGSQLQSFQRGNPDVIALRVLDLEGAGLAPGNLDPDVQAAMDAAFEQARSQKRPAYGFIRRRSGPQAAGDSGGADLATGARARPSSSSRPSSASSLWRR